MARATSPKSTRSSSRESGASERRRGKMSQVIESEDDDSADEDEDEADADAVSQRSEVEDENDSQADDLSDAGSTQSREARARNDSKEESKSKGDNEPQDGDGASPPPPPASDGSQRSQSPGPVWNQYIEPEYGLVDDHRGDTIDGVDFDVILVHGLHGKKASTWANENSLWERSLIKEDLLGYWSIRELAFWYDTNSASTHIYFPEGIEGQARKLLDDLVEARKLIKSETTRPIVFIGHDIGGIIVKKALVLAASDPAKYGNIPWETSTLIFLSVPNRVSTIEALEDELLDLISMDPIVPSLVRKASQLARNITKVNAEFQDTNMLVRASIFSVFPRFESNVSTESAECHNPFSRYTCVYETPFEFCCSTTRSHREMVQRPADGDSDWPIAIKTVINELPFYTNINEAITIESKAFLAGTPPVYPYEGKDYHYDLFSWFTGEEATTEWLASNRGLSIMHIQHNDEEKAESISQAIFSNLYTLLKDEPSRGENWVCYFRFNKDDARYRDAAAMLITFLTTILCRFSFDVSNVAEKLVEDWSRDMSTCSLADIFQGFTNLRDNYSTEKITFCVGCFDQCDDESRNWFLKELLRYGSLKESRDKWLFDSNDPNFLKDVESGLWKLDVAESPMYRPVVSPASNSAPSVNDEDRPQSKTKTEDGESARGSVGDEGDNAEKAAHQPEEDKTRLDEKDDSHKTNDVEDGRPEIDTSAVETEASTIEEASKPADDVDDEHPRSISEPRDPDEKATVELGPAPSQDGKLIPHPALGTLILRGLDERPILLNVENSLRALVTQDGGQDSPQARAVLNWVYRKSENASMATVEALVARPKSLDPDELFRSMIDFADEKTRAQAHKLVTLLRHALRPLTSHEAAVALSVMGEPRATLNDSDVAGVLGPLIHNFPGVFKLQGREVVVWSLFEPLSEDKVRDAHSAMASLCLQYLSLTEVHPLIDVHSDNVVKVLWVAFEPRNDLVSYAVRYWLDHYRLAGSSAPSAEAYAFLANEKSARSWREAGLIRANLGFPFRHYLSPIPIVASTGLDDLLERRLEEDKESATFLLDCNLALSEAAANNHSSIVKLLIRRFEPSKQALEDAFEFAASSGYEAVLDVLVEYVSRPENAGKALWPNNVLVRLGWQGLDQCMRKLLALGANPDPKDPHTLEALDPSPLTVAASGPHLNAFKALIEAGVDIRAVAKKGTSPIMVACQNGDPDIVRLLIEKGADIEVKDENGATPLQGATDWGRLKAVEVLLEHGADHSFGQVDDKEAASTTWKPVVQASENNYAKVLALLLAKGADANATGPKGCALYLAANRGYVDICKLLLDHGATANTPTTEFPPALSVAVESKKLDLVRLLLDHKADVEAEFQGSGEDDQRDTALSIASRIGATEIVELLLERGAKPNHYQGDLDPPIYLASWRGYVDIVRMLLEKGADANAKLDGQEWTAVHAAYDNPEAMRLLLANGGDPDRVADSSTALLLAVRWDNLGTLKAVLEHSPKPNLEAEDEGKMTALAHACLSDSADAPEMIRALLDEGADPNHGAGTDHLPLHQCVAREASLQALLESRPQLDARDNEGNTALHLLAPRYMLDSVRKLVMGGADIDAVNDKGLTPLAEAIKFYGTDDIVLYLLKKGAQPNVSAPGFAGVLHETIRTSNLTTLKALIKAGADVNAVDGVTGASLVYTASHAQGYSTEILKYLVEELQMPVNTFGGPFGWPLSRAVMSFDQAFEYLLSKGAEPEVEDGVGRRPAHLAAMATVMTLDTQHSLRLLIDRGVSMTTPDKMGLMPLHRAAFHGNLDSIRILLEQPGVSIDVADADGWTPLMWACIGRWQIDETVDLLLARGADIWARGAGWDKGWSPLRLARYQDQPEDILGRLEPDKDSKRVASEAGRVWDDDFHQSAVGDHAVNQCYACLSHMYGKQWRCMSCTGDAEVVLCFKCYRHKDLFHGQHEFKEEGFEFHEERVKSQEAAGEATPFAEHGNRVSGSGSESGDGVSKEARKNRRRSSSSHSDSDSDSSVGIEDEDSDEGLEDEESSNDGN